MKTAIQIFSIVSLFVLFGFDWPERVEQQPGPESALLNFAVYNFPFKANTPNGILKTDIVVNKFDFVCFRVTGRIKLGITVPESDAGGALAPHLVNQYNQISDPVKIVHGRLFCGNLDEWIPTASINEMGAHPIKKHFAIFITNHCSTGDVKFDTIRTNAFIAKEKMNLLFMLNDKQTKNNVGQFDIQVVIVPYELHRTRNRFNKCPMFEPTRTNEKLDDCFYNSFKSVDYKNFLWKTSKNEEEFHGDTNNTYRGVTRDLSGCQCTYSKSKGQLVSDGNMGTFDYAFAKYRQTGLLTKDLTTWQHIVLDVWPHVAFNEFAKATGRRFEYEPTPRENIYWK